MEPGCTAHCGKINATCRANAGYAVPVAGRSLSARDLLYLDLSPLIPNKMEIEPFYFFSISVLYSSHSSIDENSIFPIGLYIYISEREFRIQYSRSSVILRSRCILAEPIKPRKEKKKLKIAFRSSIFDRVSETERLIKYRFRPRYLSKM